MVDTVLQPSESTTDSLEEEFQLRSLKKEELQKFLLSVIDSLTLLSLSTELRYQIKRDFFEKFPEKLARFEDWYIEPKLRKTIFLSPDLEYGILSLQDLDEILAATAGYIFKNLKNEISGLETEKRTQFFNVLATLRFPHPYETHRSEILQSQATSLFGIINSLSPESEKKQSKDLEKNFPMSVSDDPFLTWLNELADFTRELAATLDDFNPKEQILNSVKVPGHTKEFAVSTLREGYTTWINRLWRENQTSQPRLPEPKPTFQKDLDNSIPLNEEDLKSLRFIDESLRAWIDSFLSQQKKFAELLKKKLSEKLNNSEKTQEAPSTEEPSNDQPETLKELIDLTKDSYAYRREVVLLKRILIPDLVNLSLSGFEGGNITFEYIRSNYPVEFAQLQDLLLQEINAQFLKADSSLWTTPQGRQQLTEQIILLISFERKNIGLIEVIKRVQQQELAKRFDHLSEKEAQEKIQEVTLKTNEILNNPEKITLQVQKQTESNFDQLHSSDLNDLLTHFDSLKIKSEHLINSLTELGLSSEQQRLVIDGIGGGILQGKSAEQFRFLTPQQFNKIFRFQPSESLCIQLTQIISDNYPFKAVQIADDYNNPTFEFNNNPKAVIILSHPELNDPTLSLQAKQKILNSIGANWSPHELEKAESFLAAAHTFGGMDSFFYISSVTLTDLELLKENNPAAYLQVQKTKNFLVEKKVEENLEDLAQYFLTLNPIERESAMDNFGPRVGRFSQFKKTAPFAKQNVENLKKFKPDVSEGSAEKSLFAAATEQMLRMAAEQSISNQAQLEEDELGYIGSLQALDDINEQKRQIESERFNLEHESKVQILRSSLIALYNEALLNDVSGETLDYDDGAWENSTFASEYVSEKSVPDNVSSLSSRVRGGVSKIVKPLRGKFLKKAKEKLLKETAKKIGSAAVEKVGVALAQPVPVLGQIAAVVSSIPPKYRKYIFGAIGAGSAALLAKVFSTAATAGSTIVGATAGAAAGAAIGSVVPIIGTTIGAVGGAIVGGVGGYFAGDAINKGNISSPNQISSSLKTSQLPSATPKPPFLSTPAGSATVGLVGATTFTAISVMLGSTQQAAFLPPPLPIEGGQSAYVLIEKKADPGSKFDQPRDITYTISITPKEGYTLTINDIRDTFAVQINTKKNTAASLTPADSPITLETLKSSNGGSTIIKSGQTVTLPAYTEKFDASYHDTGVINTVNIAFTADDGNGNAPIDKSSAKASVCFGDCPLPPTGCWPTTGTVTQLPYDFRSGPGYDHGTSKEDAWDIGFGGHVGQPIYAPFSGKVCSKPQDMSNRWGGFGFFVVLYVTPDSGTGAFKLYFAHLLKYIPELTIENTCKDVLAGDIIGYGGSSGNSTGPHLHYEYVPGGNTYADSNARKIVPDGLTELDGKRVTSCYDTNASK